MELKAKVTALSASQLYCFSFHMKCRKIRCSSRPSTETRREYVCLMSMCYWHTITDECCCSYTIILSGSNRWTDFATKLEPGEILSVWPLHVSVPFNQSHQTAPHRPPLSPYHHHPPTPSPFTLSPLWLRVQWGIAVAMETKAFSSLFSTQGDPVFSFPFFSLWWPRKHEGLKILNTRPFPLSLSLSLSTYFICLPLSHSQTPV